MIRIKLINALNTVLGTHEVKGLLLLTIGLQILKKSEECGGGGESLLLRDMVTAANISEPGGKSPRHRKGCETNCCS